jgi:predicted 3-demethylubiquinone-9 3-methyltransferase (glyoxalase superfamily)
MQKVTRFLRFDDQAEEAARLYPSLFENSRVIETTRCGEVGRRASRPSLVITRASRPPFGDNAGVPPAFW